MLAILARGQTLCIRRRGLSLFFTTLSISTLLTFFVSLSLSCFLSYLLSLLAWRQHMTAAVTDERCFNPQPRHLENQTVASCNVCGLKFYLLPSFMMRGNMWTSPCAYVRQLLPPNAVWMSKLEQVYARVLNDTRFEFPTFPPHRRNFGLDRYANEHWIAAHPHVQPCDMAGTRRLRYWFRHHHHHNNNNQQHNASHHSISDTSDMVWNKAPQRPYWKTWDFHNPQQDQRIHHDERRSRRDFFWMAGHVVQWIIFYEAQMPNHDASWVWDWFPEGHLWRDMIQRHGPERALDIMLDARNGKARTVDEMVL